VAKIKEQYDKLTELLRPTVGELISGNEKHAVFSLKSELESVLRLKADTQQVMELQDFKTNKADTYMVVQQIETIQKILISFVSVFIDSQRLMLGDLSETLA
jgi:hypothetical protein